MNDPISVARDTPISLTLKAEDLQVIMAQLQKGSYEMVAPIINNLINQIESQLTDSTSTSKEN